MTKEWNVSNTRWLHVLRRLGVVAFGTAMTLAFAGRAEAQSTIKNPTDHPKYLFEAEPHGLLGFYSLGHGDIGFGAGFRGTFKIVDPGFVKKINNTVGIGFGADWLMYRWDDCRDGDCRTHTDHYLWLPVVMQWNFHLHKKWSVFGEPGFGFRVKSPDKRIFDPFFYLGGRWHFSNVASLTMRIGYPTASVGVSFFI